MVFTRMNAGEACAVFRVVLPGLCLAATLLLSGPALADESEAAALANPYKGRSVSRVEIEGLAPDLAQELKGGLALSTRRGFPRRKPELYPNVLEADLLRARLWLARRGYPEATVEAELEPDGDEVALRLLIQPGRPRLLAAVELNGWPQAQPEPRPPETLSPGRPFADAPARRWAERLQGSLREAGYAFATVRARVSRLEGGQAALAMDVDAGRRFSVVRVELRGCPEDLQSLARKTMAIAPGSWYSPRVMEEAELRLRLLDLFRQIKLSVEEAGEDELAVVAALRPREPRSIETGAGYWTDELIRVHALWRHRNLFSGGRGVQFGGSWSLHLRELNGATWWPGMPVAGARVQLDGAIEDQVEDSYDLFLLRSSLGVRFRHSLSTTSNFALQYENIDITEKTTDATAFEATGGRLLSLVASWSRDRADDRLDPSTGSVLLSRVEGTLPGKISNDHFVSLEAGATRYLRLSERWILAAHSEAGWARPFEDSTDLLPNKRFYSGGASSMRGFARRRLGPVDAEESPLGGETKFEASAEIRFPLFWKFRGAAFLDAGQVWSRRAQTDLSELEYAAGPGLMFRTPLGPIRADVGFRLSDRDKLAPDVVIHFGIGHPY